MEIQTPEELERVWRAKPWPYGPATYAKRPAACAAIDHQGKPTNRECALGWFGENCNCGVSRRPNVV